MYRYFVFLATLLITSKIHAQQWLGISGSNYAGTYSTTANPANVVDSRYKAYVNLAGNDFFINNNFLGWDAPYSYWGLLLNTVPQENRNSRGRIVFKESYTDINTAESDKHVNLSNDTRGPAFMFSFGKQNQWGVAAYTRLRVGVNLVGVNYPTADLIRFGTNKPELLNKVIDVGQPVLNTNVYMEGGITVGKIIINNEENFFKVGITAKRLVGLHNDHIIINEAKYDVIPDQFTANIPGSDKQNIRLVKLDAVYAFTRQGAIQNATLKPQFLFSGLSAGSGWGLDVGFVYEYRPDIRKYVYRKDGEAKLDPSKNKYLFKLGVSLLDLGMIKYKNPDYVAEHTLNVTDQLLTYKNFQEVSNIDDAFGRVAASIGAGPGNLNTVFNAGLPSTLRIDFDYHLKDNWYVNTVVAQGLRSYKSVGMKMPSLLAVTPRYEKKWLEASATIALLDNYSAVTIGIAGRAGPIFIGTDHFLGVLMKIGKPRGADIFFGVNIPIFHKSVALPNACWYEQPEKRSLKEKLMFWKKRRY
jgi:hypothetical protein